MILNYEVQKMMHENQFVFAYGSNMDPAQMRERCPGSSLTWCVAEARGWSLHFPRKSEKRRGGVGSIIALPESSVWGVVFSISERDLFRLDSFEGVPKAYRRDQLEVFTASGAPHTVSTYFAIPDRSGDEFLPHKDYIQLYISGAKYFGLPKNYIKALKKTAVAP